MLAMPRTSVTVVVRAPVTRCAETLILSRRAPNLKPEQRYLSAARRAVSSEPSSSPAAAAGACCAGAATRRAGAAPSAALVSMPISSRTCAFQTNVH